MYTSQFLTILVAGLGAIAAPLQSRAVIGHDKVNGFAESASAVALKFKPYLRVVNGCVPFPAVDADGNTSGGLKPSGNSNSKCGGNTGQVYARATQYDGKYAIMYSWYMPKDSPSPGMGHRHDWEAAVVWLDDANAANPNIVGLAVSGHGGFTSAKSGFELEGGRPKFDYFSDWPTNHELGFSVSKGGEQPLIEWENLTQAAREGLTYANFGDANVPFKDGSFESNLGKAVPK